ncbi:hypothetical protein WA026_005292 [Henosepilachna vigintioctopunctata]|uniref:Ammonium transporter AmtB-like domain-containing protein n=1 Tax=Henosepilachna vigintioctopunctata TaxID=420089 RepID=A0AAW1UWK2_9CUCU
MLSGRLLPMTAAGTSFLYAGLLQPIVMHWIWHDHGWMAKRKIAKIKFSVKDHAGGLAIHLHSGVIALCGSVCLGRRLVKLSDVHQSSIGSSSPGTTFIGYIFVLVGLISFSLPYQKYEINRIPEDFMGIILLNSTIALASGLFVVIMQCFCFGQAEGYWVLLKCLQGCTAGLVTISCGIDVYNNYAAFFIASFGSVVFYTITIISERLFYEDYCNIVPIHLFCGLVGATLPPLLGSKENLGISVHISLILYHTLWQLMCILIIMLWSVTFFLPLFIFLQAMGLLANKSEELNHQRSKNVMRNIGHNSLWRIFSFSEFVPSVGPGSENKSIDPLDRLTQEHEIRRENLEAALEKKQKKSKNLEPDVEMPPAIPVEEMVKDMGILDSERYPASYEEVLEKRLNDSKFTYAVPSTSLHSKMQFPFVNELAAGDYISSDVTEIKTRKAEIRKVFKVKEKRDVDSDRRTSPRKNIKARRRRRVKRLDSGFGIQKPKRK